MAAPNIVGVSTITGKTVATSLADTNATTILSNAVSSGYVYKINNIIVANDDGTNAADITIALHNEDDGGGTGFKIASTVAVPADSTLIVLDKASSIYLEEDRSIVATASAANDLDVIISYEEIID
tara:strand:- start:4067 stop:4444 length:378 start_codon:yes stop_codon:yes gene_type:complete